MRSRLKIVRSHPPEAELISYLDRLPLSWMDNYVASRRSRENSLMGATPEIPFSEEKITPSDGGTYLLITAFFEQNAIVEYVFYNFVATVKQRAQRKYTFATPCTCRSMKLHAHALIHHKRNERGLPTFQKQLRKLVDVTDVYLNVLKYGTEQALLAALKRVGNAFKDKTFEEREEVKEKKKSTVKQFKASNMPAVPFTIDKLQKKTLDFGKLLEGVLPIQEDLELVDLLARLEEEQKTLLEMIRKAA